MIVGIRQQTSGNGNKLSSFSARFALCSLRFARLPRRSSQRKFRGSDICRELVIPPILGLTSRHSDEGYKSSVISREKTFCSNTATLKGSGIASKSGGGTRTARSRGFRLAFSYSSRLPVMEDRRSAHSVGCRPSVKDINRRPRASSTH